MVTEIKILLHVDDVVAVVSVSAPQGVQDLQLHQSLLVESRNHAAKNNNSGIKIILLHLNALQGTHCVNV